jgi:hypothetical protein
MYERKQ